MKKLFGIVGGMGPLASAEFLKTIYEFNIPDLEQESPACILFSDPAFPDRTEAILSGSDEKLISLLIKALENLCQLGISKVAIPCVTTHYFLPRIPARLRDKVISLVDLTVEEVSRTKKRHLLLCSNGTRRTGIFQRHDRWSLAAPYVVLPDDDDQNAVHGLIYQLKRNHRPDSLIPRLDALLRKYEVNSSFIAGCTEIHLLTKLLMAHGYGDQKYAIIDPLLTLAKNLRSFLDE